MSHINFQIKENIRIAHFEPGAGIPQNVTSSCMNAFKRIDSTTPDEVVDAINQSRRSLALFTAILINDNPDFFTLSEWRCLNKKMNELCLFHFNALARFNHNLYLVIPENEKLPPVNKYKLLDWTNKLGPFAKDDIGCLCIIMPKDFTINGLAQAEIGTTKKTKDLPSRLDTPLENKKVVVITNSPVNENLKQRQFQDLENTASENGCKIASAKESFAALTYSTLLPRKEPQKFHHFSLMTSTDTQKPKKEIASKHCIQFRSSERKSELVSYITTTTHPHQVLFSKEL